MSKPEYRMFLKDGSEWHLSKDGDVLLDGTRHMSFPADGCWRVIGFGTRHMSRDLISLPDAANGTDLGQGWVHDLDHGTHRMWGMPKTRRVVKVERYGGKS